MINHNRPSLCDTMYVAPFMSLGTIVPNWISMDVGEWVLCTIDCQISSSQSEYVTFKTGSELEVRIV